MGASNKGGVGKISSFLSLSVHRNVANFSFPCGVPECSRHFRKYAAFRSHVYRDHKFHHSSRCIKNVTFLCQVPFCSYECTSVTEFLAHLKNHILQKLTISCPFKNCDKSFSVKSSFTAHISRCHRDRTSTSLSGAVLQSVEHHREATQEQCTVNDELTSGVVDDSDTEPELMSGARIFADTEQFMHSISLFYLKLQAKFLLPASTIQSIVEEMEMIHNVGLSVGLTKLSERLSNLGVDESEIVTLQKELTENSPFHLCNTGEMRTNNTRQTYFRTNFKYVYPVQIYLGKDNQNVDRYAQYVPIKDTLLTLFKDDTVKSAYIEAHKSVSDGAVLNDITDGQAFHSNQFLVQNPSALRIVLYQDSFEVANPLGSGKKKHKILAVYFSLADFLPYNRSSVDQIQLLLLCREVDFKHFGQEAVFSELVHDLQSLEEIGINLFQERTPVYGAVLAIVGDNLGSHCIGGFNENFSSSNFVCRYCIVDRQTCNREPYVIGKKRTVEHYDDTVAKIENPANETNFESFGIKFRSVFNRLKHFHVCQPGLPPCLGHDLFEGIVARDLALMIKSFVKKDAYFSYETLNRLICKFSYVGADAENKPCTIKDNADKLGGHAVQNWYLLRLQPLLIGDRIQNKDSPVWRLLLLLREIVELTCAPMICLNQVALLKDLITDYLYWRVDLFPDEQVTPKHHYLAHYPSLIQQFGPLIRVWTLRFESKHGYFKACVRRLKNFKNVCSTLADRHQLLQAYLHEGSFFPPVLMVDAVIEFVVENYSEKVQHVVCQFAFNRSNTVVASKAIYKGTTYRTNMLVVLEETGDGFMLGSLLHLSSQWEKHVVSCTEMPRSSMC